MIYRCTIDESAGLADEPPACVSCGGEATDGHAVRLGDGDAVFVCASCVAREERAGRHGRFAFTARADLPAAIAAHALARDGRADGSFTVGGLLTARIGWWIVRFEELEELEEEEEEGGFVTAREYASIVDASDALRRLERRALCVVCGRYEYWQHPVQIGDGAADAYVCGYCLGVRAEYFSVERTELLAGAIAAHALTLRGQEDESATGSDGALVERVGRWILRHHDGPIAAEAYPSVAEAAAAMAALR